MFKRCVRYGIAITSSFIRKLSKDNLHSQDTEQLAFVQNLSTFSVDKNIICHLTTNLTDTQNLHVVKSRIETQQRL